jgi:hypothetical protein
MKFEDAKEWKTWENKGNENLKATILGTDYDRSKNNWRMRNISTIWIPL